MKRSIFDATLIAMVLFLGLIIAILQVGWKKMRRTDRQHIADLEGRLDAGEAARLALLGELARWKRQVERSRGAQGATAPDAAEGTSGDRGPSEESGEEPTEDSTPTLDFAALKKALGSNGLDILSELLTSESIEKTLEECGRKPEYLVTAALLTNDLETKLAYLEEALEKDPRSPLALSAYTNALIASGERGEYLLSQIEALEAVDPTNSMANYLAAYWMFEQGDASGALKELREASAKIYFDDYLTKQLPVREEFYKDAGCSPSVAKLVSPFGITMEHLPLVRDVAKQTAETVQELARQGATEEALVAARNGAEMGSRLSASGRFLIHDLVGIASTELLLAEERKLCEALGQTQRVQAIDRQIEHNQERKARTQVVAENLTKALADMSEQDAVAYMERVLREGEMSAASDLPGVREAMSQGKGAK